QQLRRENASLRAEVREAEDRLVQEESENGRLTSRLNNAMAMLKRGGLADGEVAENPTDRGSEPSRSPVPALRSNRKPRKPPFAQIPGRQVDILPSAPADDEEASTGWGTPAPASGGAGVGPQGRR